MNKMIKDFLRGLWDEHPTFRIMIGMCPTLAVTTAAINGFGMAVATTFVLVCSSILISVLKKVIPGGVRIPAYIIVIATFVTTVDYIMQAFTPDLHESLGVFIPLIVVNCIILGRAEAYASKMPVVWSAFDALGMGLGFTWGLTLIGSIRELLGSGTVFGFSIMPDGFTPIAILTSPPGAFITLGVLLALMNVVSSKISEKIKAKQQRAAN
ncbi:MAG: electron transport complex subunit E [Firmicutes bacterium]|jgi:electron transport complex protein RnfE|nr:electron transport complex subunit E [Bacillota bacterium]NLL87543.1 electron transport complex subunit E [Bacillota bacterium]HKM17852.1 electron transport complex subunit E [Limnochordia bacterium]